MKKTITISLLLLLFFSQAGYYIFYMFQQHRIKEAVKHDLLAKLPESSLEIIDAHKNNIEWEEEGREFYLHGQMYDVAYTRMINGKELIYCLNDRKEEALLKRLADAVQFGNEQNSSNKDGHHVVKFQLPDYLVPGSALITINEVVPVQYAEYSSPLISHTTEVFTPPPDLL